MSFQKTGRWDKGDTRINARGMRKRSQVESKDSKTDWASGLYSYLDINKLFDPLP